MKSGANIVKFPDHIVHCLINTKRADLKPIQQVLLGAEEGEESNLFFVTKSDTENLKKVLAAIDNHPFMVLMGKWQSDYKKQACGQVFLFLSSKSRFL